MTFQEIQKAACGKAKLPPFPTQPELLCYWSLRSLKELWDAGRIDDNEAAKEKADICRAYMENAAHYRQYVDVYHQYGERNQQAGEIVRDILVAMKEDSPDYKALLGKAMGCIGALCNESVSAQIVHDWMREDGGNHAETR